MLPCQLSVWQPQDVQCTYIQRADDDLSGMYATEAVNSCRARVMYTCLVNLLKCKLKVPWCQRYRVSAS